MGIPAPVQPVLAAVVANALVGSAELTGITEFGGEFVAGAQRTLGLQTTLLVWMCAVSAPIAVYLLRVSGPLAVTGAIIDYHLPYMVPAIAAVLILSSWLAARTARADGSLFTAILSGALGPLLAVATYYAVPESLNMWNLDAVPVAMALALATVIVAAVTGLLAQNCARFAEP